MFVRGFRRVHAEVLLGEQVRPIHHTFSRTASRIAPPLIGGFSNANLKKDFTFRTSAVWRGCNPGGSTIRCAFPIDLERRQALRSNVAGVWAACSSVTTDRPPLLRAAAYCRGRPLSALCTNSLECRRKTHSASAHQHKKTKVAVPDKDLPVTTSIGTSRSSFWIARGIPVRVRGGEAQHASPNIRGARREPTRAY